jgi:hypothetical protein
MRVEKGLLMALAMAVPGAALAQSDTAEDEARIRAEAAPSMRPAPLERQMDLGREEHADRVNVRAMGGPLVGAEIGDQGQAYETEPLAGGTRSHIIENGGQEVARVRALLGRVEPYALGGVNLTRLNVVNDAAAAGVAQDSTVVRLPMGEGVGWLLSSPETGGVTRGLRRLWHLSLESRESFPETSRAASNNQVVGMASEGGRF